MEFDIRRERPDDIKAIFAIEAAAFDTDAEARLVNLLRADDALLLSHVADIKGEIVGHAAYSLVTVTDGASARRFPALGPIAVSPARQRQGIGSALVRAGLRAMRNKGHELQFLVGSPRYYPRFGFQPAQPLGFTSDYVEPGGAHEHFMVMLLQESMPDGARGRVRFHPAFAEVS